MSDNLDNLFAPIMRDAAAAVWADPGDVRRRGRQLAYRRVVLTSVVVLLVVAVGIGSAWAYGPLRRSAPPILPAPTQQVTPDPTATGTGTPTAAPSSSSSPGVEPTAPSALSTAPPSQASAIPATAMLRGGDVGGGYTDSEWLESEDHGSLSMMMFYCLGDEYTTSRDHVAARRKWSVQANEDQYILQDVRRYQPGWAARHLTDLRTALAKCPTINVMGDAANPSTFTIVDSGFVGDGSLLVKDVRPGGDGPVTQYYAVVRQGEVETQLRIHIGATQARALSLARTAASRLCVATTTC